jgi:hypothetical protein
LHFLAFAVPAQFLDPAALNADSVPPAETV